MEESRHSHGEKGVSGPGIKKAVEFAQQFLETGKPNARNHFDEWSGRFFADVAAI